MAQAEAAAWCRLVVAGDHLAVRDAKDQLCEVSQKCIARSQLLYDLLRTSGAADEMAVPLTDTQFQLWKAHVNTRTAECSRTTRSTDPELCAADPVRRSGMLEGTCLTETARDGDGGAAASERGTGTAAATVERLCHLINAADVLIDEATKHSAVADLAALMLHAHAFQGGDSAAVGQVKVLLQDALLLTVFSRIPLQYSLRHLPTALHAVALRAHHSSIDTHSSLHLPRIDPELMHAALAASASLGRLRDLSLAGATIPRACHTCMCILRQMTTVTALSLQDIGMTAHTAAELALVLPAMPQLLSIDLSRNRMPGTALRLLRQGLRSCSSLQTLNMSELVMVEPVGIRSLLDSDARDIVSAVSALRHLTALSLGFDDWQQHHRQNYVHPMTACMPEMRQAISRMPNLRALELDCQPLGVTAANSMADMLVSASQLRHLLVCLPRVEQGDSQPYFCSAQAMRSDVSPPPPSPQAVVSCAIGCMTQLTSLQLRSADISTTDALTCMQHVAVLPQLCRMSLLPEETAYIVRGTGGKDPIALALAEVFPLMTRLTQLQVLPPSRISGTVTPDTAFLSNRAALQLVKAVTDAPQLRELRLPVCLDTLAGAAGLLLGATHVQRLQIDLSFNQSCFTLRSRTVHESHPAAVPLLPCVTSISVVDEPCNDAALHALSALSSKADFRRLYALAVVLHGTPVAQAQGLLDTVTCTPSLQEMSIIMSIYDPEDHSVVVDPFCDGLRTCTSLTHLEWGVSVCDTIQPLGQQEVLSACSCLVGLRELLLHVLGEEAREVFAAVVPQLPLRRLRVRIGGHSDVDTVTDVIMRLPHLREALVGNLNGGGGEHREGPVAAALGLPACSIVDME